MSENDGRRAALKRLAIAGGGLFAGGVIAPAARVVVAPWLDARAGSMPWIRVARLDELKDGVPVRVDVVGDATDGFTVSHDETLGTVWLVRDRDEVRALATVCPHLGCRIELARDGAGYVCPCHDSAFDRDGTKRSGPSPRDMDPVPARVVERGTERIVEVKLVRFRIGVSRREEVG